MNIRTTDTVGKSITRIAFRKGVSKFIETKEGPSELHIGTDLTRKLSRRKFILFARNIIVLAKQYKLTSIALEWPAIRSLADSAISDVALGELLTTALVMAHFEFVRYKKQPKEGFTSIDYVYAVHAPLSAIKGMKRGEIIGAEINNCRTLSNTPGGDMTPKLFSAAVRKAFARSTVKVKILSRKDMQKLGMGAVLGIAQGSIEEPQFVIAEYWGAGKSKKPPLVFIGKGVTFDSGGLNIKPGDSMLEMQMDMSGGAAVMYALAAAARLKLKVNVIALVPAVENMPSGSALRPGDIIRSLSGRTIEVLNTDAEGRVILADAITYAKRYNPTAVVEASTLTGAALTALGTHASALMATDETFQSRLISLGEESGDYLWPFPLWEEYEEMVKGNFADVSNIPASGNTRYGGVIAGGMFLREFAKDLPCPFAHVDIAPRMTSNSTDNLAKGTAGAPVRLLVALCTAYSK